jgi:hypothetical protein
VTEVGVAESVSDVPPSVAVGRFVPVQDVTEVVAHRPEPLMPIDVGVPALFEVTSTELMTGAAPAVVAKIE